MTATVNFHGGEAIKASTTGTKGAPLTIGAKSKNGDGFAVTFFTEDAALTGRLIEAINEAVAAHEAEKAEKAAEADKSVCERCNGSDEVVVRTTFPMSYVGPGPCPDDAAGVVGMPCRHDAA